MARLDKSRLSRFKSGSNGKKGSKKKIGVMEMEKESFLPTSRNTKPNSEDKTGSNDSSSCTGNMSSNQRKITFLFFTLAAFVGLFLVKMDGVFQIESDHVEEKKVVFHSTSGSFGGINNVAHPGGAKAASKGEGITAADIIIPKSNVGHAISSLNRPNILNLWGHYVHDEHRSPYASHLYDATKEELEERQEKFVEKMKKVREEWGAWDFRDPHGEQSMRAAANFSEVEYKDLPLDDFPPNAWQADEEYVANFLVEAKKLVHRVKEGIYAEYGWPTKGKEEDKEYLEQRDKFWKIDVWDPADCEGGDRNKCPQLYLKGIKEGVAVIEKSSFDGLVRKLLHGLMTNDEFYAVLGGHSAAAGHGNDFQQNRIITFQYLMEPVFDKLGMRLFSRNMAMGGVGTLQFTLAGGDLYGEMDIVEWDSGMTESGPPVDLFNKQAILSGERVPFIMNDFHFDIMKETKGKAWMGAYIPGNYNDKNLFPETTLANAASQPYAARWMNEKEEKYNAVCWEPRKDYTPEKKQNVKPGGQAGWHPGNRRHVWSGRKLALILLEALSVAFERWEEGIEKEGVPLATSYWHVGDTYKEIRENLRTHISTPNEVDGNDVRSECEKLYDWMPRVCRLQMHGFGMWTPRVHQDFNFLNLMHAAPNGYKPHFVENNVYNGFDVLPPSQAVPDGDVDVHAIAIATTSDPPDLDHNWIEDDEDSAGENVPNADGPADNTDAPPPTRRRLREASDIAFRKGAELFAPSTVVNDRIMPEATDEQSTSNIPSLRRQLDEQSASESKTDSDAIVPGRGWLASGWSAVNDFCDGSAQSECARSKDQDCLIYGGSDVHREVHGNGLSGWLVFTIPNVREGIILARIEWWCGMMYPINILTKDWTEVNNGMTHDTTPWNLTAHRDLVVDSSVPEDEWERQRNLKPTLDQFVPKDFEMDIAINGAIVKTMKREEWVKYTREAVKNVAAFPLLDDPSMAEKEWEGEPMEVAIRFRTKLKPQQNYCISHIFYA
eukprot:CAMPEP_0172357806 /NCGR_PEP_ID=MMETSP1060-20121228/2136_1 /TAXON_ID=37318 /ORGANISM="Pseudo-nitzschia pungens, Strain cf. cingulata" /LENGTH=1002 /DNA_ID=CAMNT_0013078649 /DNA_START=148 /DNA_END=3156 /DNA_ORIENTATION=+